MKELFDDIKQRVTDAAQQVGKKTEEVMNVTKIRNQIRTLGKSNDRDYGDMGRMIFERYDKGEVVDAEMLSICEEIKNREDEISALEAEINEMKKTATCGACGAAVEKGMSFCPYCGATMKETADKAEASGENEASKETETTTEYGATTEM